MDELINQITERTGIPHDVAKQAADVVIGFLKQKLPGPSARRSIQRWECTPPVMVRTSRRRLVVGLVRCLVVCLKKKSVNALAKRL